MNDENELDDALTSIFDAQQRLQERLGYENDQMSDDEIIAYIAWNNHAAAIELSEVMGEVGWKPWATSRHINRDAFVGELIDVFKFLLNQALAVGVTPGEFVDAFMAKTVVNHERHDNGYTGLEKDSTGRALDEPHQRGAA